MSASFEEYQFATGESGNKVSLNTTLMGPADETLDEVIEKKIRMDAKDHLRCGGHTDCVRALFAKGYASEQGYRIKEKKGHDVLAGII